MEVKRKLYDECIIIVKERIANAAAAMDAAHESMVGETKSSAGDKFETARAMLQAEQDRMKGVMIKTKQMAYNLSQVPFVESELIQAGSLVYTDTATYYLAEGLGKVMMEDQIYFVISMSSPLGQLLQGRKAGEEVIINGRKILITKVE